MGLPLAGDSLGLPRTFQGLSQLIPSPLPEPSIRAVDLYSPYLCTSESLSKVKSVEVACVIVERVKILCHLPEKFSVEIFRM